MGNAVIAKRTGVGSTALALKEDKANKGAALGYAGLGADGYAVPAQLGPGGQLAGSRVAPASASAAGTLAAADYELMKLGAKATVAVTMNAFGTWADGQTIVLPGIGSHTLKVTTTGDIDIVGLGEAAAKAAIVAYLNTHAGATVSVAIVGTSTTLTVTALAYGATLNGTVISGTLLAAAGTMVLGLLPQLSNPPPSNGVIVRDAAFNGPAVAVAGLSSAKRYRCILQTDDNGATENLKLQPNGTDANSSSSYMCKNGSIGSVQYIIIATHILAEPGSECMRIEISPRKGGISSVFVAGGGPGQAYFSYQLALVAGATSTDYTSLTFLLSATSRTGWLTVIEETP